MKKPLSLAERSRLGAFGSLIRNHANATPITIGLLTGVVTAVAMSSFAGTELARSAAAVVIVYVCGYVTGSLLVEPRNDRMSLPLGIVRLVAGLLLTSIAFLLSVQLPLPWFSGPAGLFALAMIRHGRAAFVPPGPDLTFSWGGTVTGLVAVVVLAPPVISAILMAPGEFPPVFFNVDFPYLPGASACVGGYRHFSSRISECRRWPAHVPLRHPRPRRADLARFRNRPASFRVSDGRTAPGGWHPGGRRGSCTSD